MKEKDAEQRKAVVFIENHKFIVGSLWTFNDDYQSVVVGSIARSENCPLNWDSYSKKL